MGPWASLPRRLRAAAIRYGECIKDRIFEIDSAADISDIRRPPWRMASDEEVAAVEDGSVGWHPEERRDRVVEGPISQDISARLDSRG